MPAAATGREDATQPPAWPLPGGLRLMAVHAHPDDESSKGAATMARYVADGVAVLVVTLTGGERGDILNKAMDRPEIRDNLPAVRRAVTATRNGRIGVIGTQATVASGAYQDAFAAARDTEITAVACPRFVDFVERGITSGRQVLGLAEGYLEPLQRADVDTLVLGCTHYPLLSGLIQLAMGESVTRVVSS